MLAGLLATTALAASSPTRTSFANGSWTGSARLTQTIEGITLSATSSFTMQVRAGRVSGTLTSRGSADGTVEGQRLSMTMSGGLPLSGVAASPSARGTLAFAATVQGKRQTGSLPALATLTNLRGSCSRMTGKLSIKLADATQLLSAPFSAARAAGGPAC